MPKGKFSNFSVYGKATADILSRKVEKVESRKASNLAYPKITLAVGSRVQPGRSGSGLTCPGLRGGAGSAVHRHSTTVRLQFAGGLLITIVSAAAAASGLAAFVTSVRISSKAWTNRLKRQMSKFLLKNLILGLSGERSQEQ
jgi:hypothetical protein